MKYAVFTDLDDTFFYRGVTPQKNLEAVKRARENGHFVFINTGRSTGIIPEELLENVFDGIVASVGGEVYIGKETVVKEVFSSEDVLHFAEEFLLENRVFVFEATATGNLLAQMLASGEIKSLSEGKDLIKQSFEIKEINA